jgi:hypothetical protein
MNRVREVIEAQEELIAAQNVLIEWLLSQVQRRRRPGVGPERMDPKNCGNRVRRQTAATQEFSE